MIKVLVLLWFSL